MSPARPRRVLLACDDPFGRAAFRAATDVPELELVGATTVREAAGGLANDVRPDVVVLDAQLPALEALRALREIHESVPESRILVFSSPESIEFGWLCLTLGASGYLSKEIDLASLPRILERLSSGEAVVSRRLATQIVDRLRNRERQRGGRAPSPITAPERQLIELIHTGRSAEEAAGELGVTIATIRRHLASSRRKLALGAPRVLPGTDFSPTRLRGMEAPA